MKRFLLRITIPFLCISIILLCQESRANITSVNILKDTICVPDDYPSIQEAIDASVDEDIIIVESGIFVENINFSGKNITVASHFLITGDQAFINQTIIDGDSSGTVVTFENNEPSGAMLIGFTIRNGSGNHEGQGGGIFILNAEPTLSDLIIDGNTANQGGGIYCGGPSVVNMYNVTVTNNTSVNQGGGMRAVNSQLYFDRCNFSYNIAEGSHGGAIYYQASSTMFDPFIIDINETEFIGNHCEGGSGGVYLRRNDDTEAHLSIQIHNSIFRENTSMGNTGLRISGQEIDFRVENCRFLANEAVNYAAGVSFTNYATGSVYNSIFAYNMASTGGGGFNCGGANVWGLADVRFVNCDFVENTAAIGAGLTAGGGGKAELYNCIFRGNEYNQIALVQWSEMGGELTINYSNIQYGQDSVNISPLSVLNWGDGNIDADPLFLNGGEDPFTLTEGSPCIDTGTPDTTGSGIPDEDIIGNVRVWDGGSGIERIDMGAYEYGSVPVGINHPGNTRLTENNIICYPNPFSNQTGIYLKLLKTEEISINIYDHLGRQTEILTNGMKQAGDHHLTWNPPDQSPGLYFYNIRIGNKTFTGKMILVK